MEICSFLSVPTCDSRCSLALERLEASRSAPINPHTPEGNFHSHEDLKKEADPRRKTLKRPPPTLEAKARFFVWGLTADKWVCWRAYRWMVISDVTDSAWPPCLPPFDTHTSRTTKPAGICISAIPDSLNPKRLGAFRRANPSGKITLAPLFIEQLLFWMVFGQPLGLLIVRPLLQSSGLGTSGTLGS